MRTILTNDSINTEIKNIQKKLRERPDPNDEIRLTELLLMKEIDARVGSLLLSIDQLIPEDHMIKHSVNYKRLQELFYD